MAKRTGGFIGQDGINAPDPATGVTGTAGNEQVTVSWTAPSDVGGAAITGYNVVADDGSSPFPSVSGTHNDTFNSTPQAPSAVGVYAKPDGTAFYIADQNNLQVYQYSLSTPWDLSTASYTNKAASFSGSYPQDVFIGDNGSTLYSVNLLGTQGVYQYPLSTAYDVDTKGASSFFSVASQVSLAKGVSFKSDGLKMYVAAATAGIHQYSLSSAWDVTTASYDSVSFVPTNDSESVSFTSDGLYMFVADATQGNVAISRLSTAWDLSSAVDMDQPISVSAQESFATGAVIGNNKSTMLVTGNGNDDTYSYDIEFVDYPTSSPVTVSGLTNGTSYTFNVWAINPFGWSSPSDASEGVTPVVPSTGMMAGGNASVTVQTVDISTLGNASDFGDLSRTTTTCGSVGSLTRACCAGGNSTTDNVIDFFTFATAGNASDFGDLTRGRAELGGAGNSTRGLFIGGSSSVASRDDTLDYITIASTGNATDFGNLTIGRNDVTGAANSTRAVAQSGYNNSFGGNQNVIDYVTIASTGNASDFGDLTVARSGAASAASSTRAVAMGGSSNNVIDYITIASTGNATDFGDLTQSVGSGPAGFSSNTRAIRAGGYAGSTSNVMDYITIASTGNAADFGDMYQGNYRVSGCSNCHGGLQ